MKIKEFMITDVISITEDAKIVDLLELIVKNKIGGVPVLDKAGKLKGMVSDGDIIRFLQPNGRTVYDMYMLILVSEKEGLKDKLQNSINLPVTDIMKKQDIYTVYPDDKIEKALDILAKHRFKKIPVINKDDRVIGVISRGDLIRYISTKLIGS